MAARDCSQGLPPHAGSLVCHRARVLRAAAGPGQGQQDSHLLHRLVRAGLNLLLVTQLEQKEDQLYRRVGGELSGQGQGGAGLLRWRCWGCVMVRS